MPVDDFEDVEYLCAEPWDQSALRRVGPERADSIIILDIPDALPYHVYLPLAVRN